ncbi:hypothetical protein IWQ60_011260, partial [Tieghemiomyces parasiticus]
VQYVTLRNILLILQRRPELLKNQLKAFFCKYDDPIYVKLSKLEILIRLTTPRNYAFVLPELQEYAAEVDVDFVRKAVRSIGRLAIKIEVAAERCIEVLLELIHTKVNYVVQEAVVVIKDIFRKYPNRYESIIGVLCENLDSLDDSEAKAAMIWIVGQYADRIENADEVLESFLDSFLEETTEVQLALLTATVKLFIMRPTLGQELVPKVLKWATEEVDNPDLRDRGYIYWRLLSTDPAAAKEVILSTKPDISAEAENLDPLLLEELLMNISSLAAVYHKPPASFVPGAKRRLLPASKVLQIERPAGSLPLPSSEDGDENVTGGDSTDPTHTEETSADQLQTMLQARDDLEAMANPYALDTAEAPSARIPPTLAMNSQLIDLLDLDFNDDGSGAAHGAGSSGGPHGPVTPSGLSGALGGMTGFATNYGDGQTTGDYAQLESEFLQGPETGRPPANESAATVQNNPFATSNLSSPTGPGGFDNSPAPTALTKAFTNTFNPGEDAQAALDRQLGALQLTPAVQQSPFQPALPSPAPPPMTTTPAPVDLSGAGDDDTFVPGKQVFLAAAAAKGLEVAGTFARRRGQLTLDLTFGNQSPAPVGDFAIQFNKNSFGLWPAANLAVPTLQPGQMYDTSLPLHTNGPVQSMTPINNLQIALKTSSGVFYFQTPYLVHILFQDDATLGQTEYLTAWKEIPDAHQKLHTLYALKFATMLQVRQKLHRNNVFTVAERVVDGLTHFYVSAKTLDGSVFLSEIKIDKSFQVGHVATKSFASHLVEPYQAAVVAILGSGASSI